MHIHIHIHIHINIHIHNVHIFKPGRTTAVILRIILEKASPQKQSFPCSAFQSTFTKQGLAEGSLVQTGASFRGTMQLIYLMFCSTAIHQVFSNQCCVPLSLPYSASQPQTASAIGNLPTISFGQVVSQGHGTVPSTAKPVRIREVDIQFSVVNATCSIFFVMAVE